MGRHRLDRLELVENGSNPPPCIVAVRNLSQREESFPPLVPTILLVFHMCFTVVLFVCSFTEIYTPVRNHGSRNECCRTLFLFMVAELDRAPGSFGFRSGSQDLKL